MQNSHFITLIRENFFKNTGAAGLDKREFSMPVQDSGSGTRRTNYAEVQ